MMFRSMITGRNSISSKSRHGNVSIFFHQSYYLYMLPMVSLGLPIASTFGKALENRFGLIKKLSKLTNSCIDHFLQNHVVLTFDIWHVRLMICLFFMLRLKLKAYYTYAGGFYTYALFALIFWETRRSDFLVTMVHHIATIILIVLSYVCRYFWVEFIHDCLSRINQFSV